jgi:hypothetical protein
VTEVCFARDTPVLRPRHTCVFTATHLRFGVTQVCFAATHLRFGVTQVCFAATHLCLGVTRLCFRFFSTNSG